ncbi:thioesterase II family protein [Actinoplanes sp. N902-109]|uniref:thioesterase II family protein n=1 Tax=Actinoplanes sp. (strain N902-109) TaxID=649831 RepID=UPI0003296871|nr:alpha/beta fold hydrolase [Actinoplanes sp. N902-109]AGL16172.1 cadicidin biosynthesis thioesterase [Actinoplanes sp. N902-109]
MTVRTANWLRRFQPAMPDAPLLVVLPHAGGSATHFRPLAAAMGRHVEVAAVQYPGRQDRYGEQPVTDLAAMAAIVATALAPMAGRRFALFGHSMGAAVAFEIARLMERRDQPAEALFLSAKRAPCLPQDPLPDLDDAALVEQITTMGGTAEQLLLDEELLEMYLPVLRADYLAMRQYICELPAVIDAPITGLVGDSDPGVSCAEVTAWNLHTRGRFDLRVFPGGHFYLDEQTTAVAHTVLSVLKA